MAMTTPDNIPEYINTPIPYRLEMRRVLSLSLGYRARNCAFDWRPYDERTPEARADFDRLAQSIAQEGIRKPIICTEWPHLICKGTEDWTPGGDLYVMIGQRRAEIAARLGITHVQCAIIEEDTREWWKYDIERLNKLKAEIGEVVY